MEERDRKRDADKFCECAKKGYEACRCDESPRGERDFREKKIEMDDTRDIDLEEEEGRSVKPDDQPMRGHMVDENERDMDVNNDARSDFSNGDSARRRLVSQEFSDISESE